MGKLSNTLLILTLLSSGKKYTAKELAETIEVTPRQIRTYMEDLEKAGIYVEVSKGRYGGYYYKENDYDYKVHFDIDEVSTLEKIHLYFKDYIIDEELYEKLGLIIEKIRYITIYSKHKNYEQTTKDDREKYDLLSNAIYKKDEVLLVTKKNNRIKERGFVPHSIYYNDSIYYVTGYCKDVKEIRTFPFYEIFKIIV